MTAHFVIIYFLKLSFALFISYSYGLFISLVALISLTLESLHISIMVGHKWPDCVSAFTPQMCQIVTNIAYAVASAYTVCNIYVSSVMNSHIFFDLHLKNALAHPR